MERIQTYAAGNPNLRVLVVGSGSSLADECRGALGNIPDRRAVLYTAESAHDAVEIAKDRQPQFAIAETAHDTAAIALLSRELHDVAPDIVVAAAYHASQFTDGVDNHAIIDLLRADVRDFLRRPISPVELGSVLDRLFSTRTVTTTGPLGRVVSFVSNKGGVGKSTMSVNVACALAQRHPGQVLLIDASLQLGVCALMLGLSPTATILDAVHERGRLDDALLRGLTAAHHSGLRLLAAPGDALEAADVGDEGFARLLHVARRAFEYVIVDTFPLLDSVVMAALDVSDLVFIALQGTAPSVAGIVRLLPVLDGLGFPHERQRIVLNRNHRRFLGDLTVTDVEARLGRRVDHAVPYDRGVLVSMNTGEPRVLHAPPWNRFGREVRRMARAVEQLTVGQQRPALDPGAMDLRDRFDPERRSGRDRRVRNVGYIGGERRSGTDRRAETTVDRVREIEIGAGG
ncbi:MAG TPA: AAA family ATPase [Vicinamibacterales bacterium]|jgi:pilus assembly protein CpaE